MDPNVQVQKELPRRTLNTEKRKIKPKSAPYLALRFNVYSKSPRRLFSRAQSCIERVIPWLVARGSIQGGHKEAFIASGR